MKRLTEKIVFLELVTAWRLAAWPTRRSPLLVKATTEGVVRAPSEFSRTTGSPFSMMAMQELVVPKSMPRIFAIYPHPCRMRADGTKIAQDSNFELLTPNIYFKHSPLSGINRDKTSRNRDRVTLYFYDIRTNGQLIPIPHGF